MVHRRHLRIAILSALCAVLLSAKKANCELPAESYAKVQLIAEDSRMPRGRPLWTGILFTLAQGWHIYWQNAGDSGEPPAVQWELPPGFTVGPIAWPQPARLGGGSIIDYGYEGQVFLMVPISGPPGSTAIALPKISAVVKYIVCRDICVPGRAHLTLSFPQASQASERRALFERARTQLPKTPPSSWSVSAVSDKDHFVLFVRTNSLVQGATFFPINAGDIENSAAQGFASTTDGFRITLQKSSQLTKSISVLRGLVVLGPRRAFEVNAPVISQ